MPLSFDAEPVFHPPRMGYSHCRGPVIACDDEAAWLGQESVERPAVSWVSVARLTVQRARVGVERGVSSAGRAPVLPARVRIELGYRDMPPSAISGVEVATSRITAQAPCHPPPRATRRGLPRSRPVPRNRANPHRPNRAGAFGGEPLCRAALSHRRGVGGRVWVVQGRRLDPVPALAHAALPLVSVIRPDGVLTSATWRRGPLRGGG
jgi:hypothetical protein